MVVNLYLIVNLHLNYRPHISVADQVKPGHGLLTFDNRHTLLTAATGNSQNDR